MSDSNRIVPGCYSQEEIESDQRIAELEAELAKRDSAVEVLHGEWQQAEAENEKLREHKAYWGDLSGLVQRAVQAEATLAEKQLALDAMEHDRDLLWDEKDTAMAELVASREMVDKLASELAALKGRRCGGCEHDGVCAVQRAGWTQFRLQPFSCCCWTEKVTK